MPGADGSSTVPGPATSRRLWLLAILFFGVGDAASTGVGLTIPGVSEMNPRGAALIEAHGFAAVVGTKLVVFIGAFLLWRYTPKTIQVGVPIGLTLLGIGVTAWNIGVLLEATSTG